MNQIIMGQLLGIEETKLSLQTSSGRQAIPRRDLGVSVEWAFSHMGCPVLCLLEDGIAVRIEATVSR